MYDATKHNLNEWEHKGVIGPDAIGGFADGVRVDLMRLVDGLSSGTGIRQELILLKSTDGAGTKPLVHQLYRIVGGKDRTALASCGIDAVNMVANDLVCAGAEPFLFTDYVAWNTIDLMIARDLARGLTIGLDDAHATLIGGENASLSEMIKGVPKPDDDFYLNGVGYRFHNDVDRSMVHEGPLVPQVIAMMGAPGLYMDVHAGAGYDICCDGTGLITDEKALTRPLDGSRFEPGDIIIGLRSSGIHCNGISLARRSLIDYSPMGWHGLFKPDEKAGEFGGRTALEELLTPTVSYVVPVLGLLGDSDADVKGIVNVTGEGIDNLRRLLKPTGLAARFDFANAPGPQPIFTLIQERSGASDREMHQDFNMGWGMYVIVSGGPGSVKEALGYLNHVADVGAVPVGRIAKGRGIEMIAHSGNRVIYR
ncbi:hypothetical protein JXB02_05660 [Candidatus Woesearchaeota archaeon]|nr:hypothetical protein [Candidatus Woesearchaeota archaeon]